MAATMRAAVLAAPGEVKVERVPLPEPGPRQVRVKLDGTGLCGSDLPLFEGRPWFEYPREPGAPGHEGFGRIDAVGEGVEGWRVGDRVAGLFGRALAEHEVAPADQLVRAPTDSFLAEPVGCAVNAFRRSRVASGDTVAVVGAGFLGALLAGLCADAGATVIAVSRREESLRAAEAMGAKHALALREEWQVVQEAERITGGKLCDRVLEVTGKQAPLDLAAKLTRVRGTLVIAGYHQDGPRSVDMQLWNWRGLDVVNAHERDPAVYLEGMREAARLAESGRLDARRLVTHTFPLEEAGAAFAALRDRPPGFVKAVVRP